VPAAPREGRARPASPGIGDESPEITAPDQPVRLEGARTSRLSRDPQRGPREDDEPLLSVRDVTLAPVAGSDSAFDPQPAQSGNMTADASEPVQVTPVNSAPRRGFLSGLFSNLGWNWTRR
jgi:hypothetical protein